MSSSTRQTRAPSDAALGPPLSDDELSSSGSDLNEDDLNEVRMVFEAIQKNERAKDAASESRHANSYAHTDSEPEPAAAGPPVPHPAPHPAQPYEKSQPNSARSHRSNYSGSTQPPLRGNVPPPIYQDLPQQTGLRSARLIVRPLPKSRDNSVQRSRDVSPSIHVPSEYGRNGSYSRTASNMYSDDGFLNREEIQRRREERRQRAEYIANRDLTFTPRISSRARNMQSAAPLSAEGNWEDRLHTDHFNQKMQLKRQAAAEFIETERRMELDAYVKECTFQPNTKKIHREMRHCLGNRERAYGDSSDDDQNEQDPYAYRRPAKSSEDNVNVKSSGPEEEAEGEDAVERKAAEKKKKDAQRAKAKAAKGARRCDILYSQGAPSAEDRQRWAVEAEERRRREIEMRNAPKRINPTQEKLYQQAAELAEKKQVAADEHYAQYMTPGLLDPEKFDRLYEESERKEQRMDELRERVWAEQAPFTPEITQLAYETSSRDDVFERLASKPKHSTRPSTPQEGHISPPTGRSRTGSLHRQPSFDIDERLRQRRRSNTATSVQDSRVSFAI